MPCPAERPWKKCLMNAVRMAHSSVIMWFGKNGEPFTRSSLVSAMHTNSLPMVKYLIQNGAAEDESEPTWSIGKTWSIIFDHKYLPILAFVYRTVFRGKVPSDLDMEEAMQRAIRYRSLPLLRWLQRNYIHSDAGSAQKHATSHFDGIKYPIEVPVLDWLERQVCPFAERYRSS